MRTLPLITKSALAGALAFLITGCAGTSDSRLAADGGVAPTPFSTLTFSPVTEPDLLVKWSQDFPGLRKMETYTLAAPVGETEITGTTTVAGFREDLAPGTVFVEAAGAGVDPEPRRVIRHAPHQR